MKNLVTLLLLGAISASTSFASSFTLNGTAVNNAANLAPYNTGDTAVWVVNGGGAGAFSVAALENLAAGISLATSGSLGGYEIAGSNGLVEGGPSKFVFGISSVDVTASAGDAFGLIVFNNSIGTTIASDTYTIFTDATWVLPSVGGSTTFGTSPLTLTSGGTNSSVVTEPSAYALLSGFLALSWVMVRRRA